MGWPRLPGKRAILELRLGPLSYYSWSSLAPDWGTPTPGLPPPHAASRRLCTTATTTSELGAAPAGTTTPARSNCPVLAHTASPAGSNAR